jgi:hypothetical protein
MIWGVACEVFNIYSFFHTIVVHKHTWSSTYAPQRTVDKVKYNADCRHPKSPYLVQREELKRMELRECVPHILHLRYTKGGHR